MPSNHGRRLDDRETLRPPRPPTGDHDPKRAVDWPEPRPRSYATKNRKLLAEHEVLRNEARTGPQCRAQRAENGLQDREHRGEVRAGRVPCHPPIDPADAVCWALAPARGASEGILRKCIFHHHRVQADQPWRAILAAADTVDAELIVLGSHGYHGWDRILGTTAGKIANLAQRNVLIVLDRKHEAHGRR
jgi:hypothetical protein